MNIFTLQRSLATLFLALLAIMISSAHAHTSPHMLGEQVGEAESPDAVRPSPRYLLQNGRGRAVMVDDFHNRFQLITFGYTSCPDVCPTTMLEMHQVMQALGERAKQVQPIFITVDPQRDTGEVLDAYTANFDARIIGLTGNPRLVRWAADNFKVEFEKVQEPGAEPHVYTMNHTVGMFLLGPDSQLLKKFAYATPVKAIITVIDGWLDSNEKLPKK